MRTIFKIIPSILVATAIVATAQDSFVSQPAGAQGVASESTMDDAFAQAKDIVKDRLEIGFRFTRFTLVDNKKESGFLGSINELEDDQSDTPTLFGRFFVTPYVGVEIGYDKVSAVTRKWTTPGIDGTGDKSKDSDGTIVLQGPLVEIVGRYPNETIVTPFAGFGPVFYGTFLGDANFEHSSWWHNGFGAYDDPNYIDWKDQGSPAWPNGGYQRTIELSDTMGWILSGGASVAVYKGLEFEFSMQYVWAEVDAHYTLSHGGRVTQDMGTYTFPMDHWTYQLGLKYAF
jgi:outer membrane protein W